MKAHVPGPPLVLLYDGDCRLCAASVRWLRARVDDAAIHPVPYQAIDTAGERVRAATRGRDLAGSIHAMLPDGSVRHGAAAVLAAGRRVPGWRWLVLVYDHPPGHALLEPLYRLVAGNRDRIGRALGLPAACASPHPASRRR